MQDKVSPKVVLKDPEFYQLPVEERIKVLDTIDPDFKGLPAVEKVKVVKAFENKTPDELETISVKEAPFYEKVWRQFAYGSGQFLDTAGELFGKVSKLITPDPRMQYQAERIANKIKQVGKDTKEYWQADAPEYKFHGTVGEIGNEIIREIPSLIGFSPAMNASGRLAATLLNPKSRLGKSVVDFVGSGLGYTAVNLAGREDYDLKDAGVDTAIDFAFGAGSPIVAKAVKTVSKKAEPIFEELAGEIKTLVKDFSKVNPKNATKKLINAYKALKNGDNSQFLKETDEVLNMEDVPPQLKQKLQETQNKLKTREDLPETVKETGAETTDAYVDVKFQNNDFNKTIKLAIEGKLPAGQLIKIGRPSKILQLAGIPDKEIVLARKIIKNKISKHELTLEDLKDFNIHLNDPLAVYQSPKNENKVILIPKLKGNNLLISAIEINSKRRGATEVNDIRTIYFKDIDKLNKEIQISPQVNFVNKNKLSEFLRASAQSNSGQDQKLQELINNLIQKYKKSSGDNIKEFYAGVPLGKVFESADYIENQIKKQLSDNIGFFWDKTFNDPENVFKKIGKEKYYELAKKAFEKQDRLEKGYRKILEKINSYLKTDTDREIFENILHIRDRFKLEKVEDIELALGKPLPENIRNAYIVFDSGMKWAARQLKLDNLDIKSGKWKPYLQLITEAHLQKVKERHLRKGKIEKAEAIEKQIEKGEFFKELPKKIVNLPKQEELQKKFVEKLTVNDFKTPEMRRLASRLNKVKTLYGYIPHVFNNYYVTDKKGNILATFKKEVEAEKFIKENPNVAVPEVREFQFKLVNFDDLEDPKKFKKALKERINSLSFHRYIGFKENRKGVGGWENFPYLVYNKDGEIIGRFKTLEKAQSFAKQKGGQLVELKGLPDKNLLSDIEWYLHKVARYRAMEDVKPKLISMFLSDYGLNLPKDTPIEEIKNAISKIPDKNKRIEAEYIADFINAVLGNPGKTEQFLNEVFTKDKRIKKIAERLGLAYGDRPALVLMNKMYKLLTHIFLGFLKPIQFIVQLSTIPSNTWPLLAKQLAESGEKHELLKAGEFVLKAMYKFLTDKRMRAIALRMVSDSPTIAEMNQYTRKTFSKGLLEKISLFPLISGDRLARAIAFLAKYEHLKATGYKGNKVKIAKEFALQTNFNMKVYDTPPALRNIVVRAYMMFKPFLIKEINFLLGLPWKYRVAGSMMLATFLGTHAMLGYELLDALGVTDWVYENIGKPIENQLVKTGKIGRDTLETIREYGLLGALTGMALYKNMGIGDIFSSVADTSSAPLQYIDNMGKAVRYAVADDEEKAKYYASKLLPSYLRKVKDAIDALTTGYIYREGKPIIKASTKEAVALLLGATPVKLQKFYNMKEKLKDLKEERRIEKDKLMRQLEEAYTKKDKAKFMQIVKTLIQEGYFTDMQSIKQAFYNYLYNKKVPSEIKIYTKPEARMLLKEKSKEELQELYNRFYKEYKNTKDPLLRKGYERALRNIVSVMRVKKSS